MFTKSESIYLTFLATIFALVVIICPILAACGIFENNSEKEAGSYAMTAIVTKTDRDSDEVTIEDSNGNIWVFTGVEDWEVNDCASVLMSDNGTPRIFDDTIISVRYNSWNLLGK